MALHILRHVEAHQLDTQHLGQLLGDLGFTNTRWPREQEGTFWLLRRLQASASQLDRCRERLDGRILTKHHHLQVPLDIAQQILVAGRDVLRWDAGNIRDHILDLGHVDGLLALALGLQPLPGASFVDDINGLVRKMAVGDIPVRQFCGNPQSLVGVLQIVVLLEVRLQTLEDLVRILNAGLIDIDFLEPAGQCTVLFENSSEFLEGGGTNAPDLAGTQHRLQQIGSVHNATGCRTGTDNGVDLVDKQDRMILFLELRQQPFQALLEITPVLGARKQSTQIQGVDHGVGNDVRYLAVHDPLGQAFGDGGLANAGLTDQQRIVLAPAHQNLDHPLDLVLTADQRINPALAGLLVQVGCVAFQWFGMAAFLASFIMGRLIMTLRILGTLNPGDPVGHKVDHINAGNALFLQDIYCLAFLLAENCDQYVSPGYFFLTRGLHMKHRPLQYPLETQSRLGLAFTVTARDQWCR